MSLDAAQESLVEPHLNSVEATEAIVFGMCWPNDSTFVEHLAIHLDAGERLDDAAERLNLPWTPKWLLDAGYRAFDAAGSDLTADAPATIAGPVSWQPDVRLCRVDDQVADNVQANPGGAPFRRRVAGEVALTALWSATASTFGIALDVRPLNLGGNTRGALFKDLLVYLLQRRLPAGWRIEPEVFLTSIRGLHMRQNVGGRRSDIVVVDEGNRLVAVVSSKWTWRSDRGTEAAQMVPLMRYRPDVPYALVTAEFPRASTVARESIEDRAYHVCPDWVGAWLAINRLATSSPREAWPTLAALRSEGTQVAETIGLPGLNDLVNDLTNSGTIL
ncbi:MAG: hypothetical protein ACT4OX_01790 [Actinomycetota bacterium]